MLWRIQLDVGVFEESHGAKDLLLGGVASDGNSDGGGGIGGVHAKGQQHRGNRRGITMAGCTDASSYTGTTWGKQEIGGNVNRVC